MNLAGTFVFENLINVETKTLEERVVEKLLAKVYEALLRVVRR